MKWISDDNATAVEIIIKIKLRLILGAVMWPWQAAPCPSVLDRMHSIPGNRRAVFKISLYPGPTLLFSPVLDKMPRGAHGTCPVCARSLNCFAMALPWQNSAGCASISRLAYRKRGRKLSPCVRFHALTVKTGNVLIVNILLLVRVDVAPRNNAQRRFKVARI